MMTPPAPFTVAQWLKRQVAWLQPPLVAAPTERVFATRKTAASPIEANPVEAKSPEPKPARSVAVPAKRPRAVKSATGKPAGGLSLALQGGGAIGAFTWGVLDRLLEAEIPIDRITGASAGALNGVVLAAALAKNGPAAARKALAEVWKRVSEAGRMGGMSSGSGGLDLAKQMFSPYQFNPFDVNPIRDILGDAVDWAALRSEKAPPVFVSATRIADGRARIFTGAELTLDAVLASTALPGLSRAVEIDGEAYWDGGYSANPPLDALLSPDGAPDILLVRLNPTLSPGLPMTVRTIADRVSQIVFDRPLLDALDRLAPVFAEGRFRLHQVTADRALDGLPPGSAGNLDWTFLTGLRDAGRAAAEAWLNGAGAALVPAALVPAEQVPSADRVGAAKARATKA